MDRFRSYRIAILILSLIVVVQFIFIIIVTKKKKIPEVPVAIKGRIAIVIDDWGYNLNNLHILDQIKYPLTTSVLPNLQFSKTVAKLLHQKGCEVILHIPMEPYEKLRLEKNTIMVSMDESTVKKILGQALESVSYAKGVSNHMGSRASEDSRIMAILFKELKKRKIYFLDSLVSSESVGFDLAHKMQVRFAKRDVFLDNTEEPEYIKSQIYKLKIRAAIFGKALGIGHDRKTTLEVLKETLPELEKEGYRFVFVSELIR